MGVCEKCGAKETLPFNCRRCGSDFCVYCRLPETHNCSRLHKQNIFKKLSRPDRENESLIQIKNKDDYFAPQQSSSVPEEIKISDHSPKKQSSHLMVFLKYLSCVMLATNIAFPFIFSNDQLDTSVVFGNPKPVYVYDIANSCDTASSRNISQTLDHLSGKTEVRFVHLPYPFALLTGGIDYECSEVLTTPLAVGEAESGMILTNYLIFVWNEIRLTNIDRTTILHETLHVMGFGHRYNSKSVMHYSATSDTVDVDLIDFIKDGYANNYWAYLNILPLNLNVFIVVYFYFFRKEH